MAAETLVTAAAFLNIFFVLFLKNILLFEKVSVAVGGTYARFDYILVSPSMQPYWLPADTYIPTIPNWGVGSDHRPIVASFMTEEK